MPIWVQTLGDIYFSHSKKKLVHQKEALSVFAWTNQCRVWRVICSNTLYTLMNKTESWQGKMREKHFSVCFIVGTTERSWSNVSLWGAWRQPDVDPEHGTGEGLFLDTDSISVLYRSSCFAFDNVLLRNGGRWKCQIIKQYECTLKFL